MTRQILPYFNASQHGQGLEGAANYSNSLVDYLLIPAFLLVVWAGAIYVWSRGEHKMGAGIAFISFLAFMMAIIAQTFTLFGQITIFIFFVGILAGIVIHFIES